MPVWIPLVVPLVAVMITLSGGWLVTTRVTDRWDRVKKTRELDLAAASDFQRLYGEAVSIWKTWNALMSAFPAGFAPPQDAKWTCLLRATAAEGQFESLLAKLAAERVLDQGDIAVLGGLRQAFKSLRRHIRANETIPWTSDRSKEYMAFKSLASAMSALLTRNHPRKQPSAAAVNQAFAEITANRHERTWTAVPSTREP